MINVQNIVTLWEQDEAEWKKLGKLVEKFFLAEIYSLELFPEITHRTKELLSIIKKIKKKQKKVSNYSYSDLKDKLGFRVICPFMSDLQKIDNFITTNFIVHKVEYKSDGLDYDKLDYISNHYDISLNCDTKYFKSHTNFKDYVFEVQVRTLNQHAWSNASHNLLYKQESEISPKLKRKVYRLLSLYEISDEELESVNSYLKEQPDDILFTLLRKLEGKIYKYAKVDFDRETSITALKNLIAYFSQEEISRINLEIENFISLNDNKIVAIFEENKNRYHEITFLTQPEIFLVWYALENYPFSMTDNWDADFFNDDLEQIKSLWGAIIS